MLDERVHFTDVEASARAMGLQIDVIRVGTSQEISDAFASFVRERPDAVFVAPSPFLGARRVQLALLAALHKIPAVYPTRNFVDVGGLIGYGADLTDAYRQMGSILAAFSKARSPRTCRRAVDQVALVINAETARILGLTVPHSLLSRADDMIEHVVFSAVRSDAIGTKRTSGMSAVMSALGGKAENIGSVIECSAFDPSGYWPGRNPAAQQATRLDPALIRYAVTI